MVTPRKIDRSDTQVGMVRRHATALLDAAAAVIPNVDGLRLRHVSVGGLTIIETGPTEWHIGKAHWALDIYRKGARVFAAQWHAPDPHDYFSDGLDCGVFSRSDYNRWLAALFAASPPAVARDRAAV